MEIQSLPSGYTLPKSELAAALTAVLLFGAGVLPARAGALTASVMVKAVVLPVASMKTIREPTMLTITEEDVRNGYVDVADPSLVEVRTNSRRGSILTLAAGNSAFRGVEVTLQGRTVTVGPQGGMIMLQTVGSQVVSMSYRLLLEHDARPGIYPWPFSLSVSPLQ